MSEQKTKPNWVPDGLTQCAPSKYLKKIVWRFSTFEQFWTRWVILIPLSYFDPLPTIRSVGVFSLQSRAASDSLQGETDLFAIAVSQMSELWIRVSEFLIWSAQ